MPKSAIRLTIKKSSRVDKQITDCRHSQSAVQTSRVAQSRRVECPTSNKLTTLICNRLSNAWVVITYLYGADCFQPFASRVAHNDPNVQSDIRWKVCQNGSYVVFRCHSIELLGYRIIITGIKEADKRKRGNFFLKFRFSWSSVKSTHAFTRIFNWAQASIAKGTAKTSGYTAVLFHELPSVLHALRGGFRLAEKVVLQSPERDFGTECELNVE